MAQASLDVRQASVASVARTGRMQALWFAAYSVAALGAFFYVPYMVPKKPSASLSYAFGYNNQAAIVLILLFTGIGALWLRRSSLFAIPQGVQDVKISRKALGMALLGTAVMCAVAWRLVVSATPVADSGYILDRIRLAAAGQRPYIDFEFAYGPAFLYPPIWIAHLLHIRVEAAYYCLWVLSELGGVFLLFRVINEIDIPSSAKSRIFLLCCAASGAASILGAISYTFLRFALAPYAALQVRRISRAEADGFARTAIVVISVVLWYSALLVLSPEIGLAFAMGVAAYLFLVGKRGSVAWWAGYIAMLGAVAAVSVAANALHLLDTLKTFSGGARDFPIFPAGHILLFVACLFFGMLELARRIFSAPDSTSVCLILVSIPMLASALGSADPLHVFFSGLGFLIVGFLYLSQWKRFWGFTCLWFSVCFVMLIFAGLYIEYSKAYDAKVQGLDDPHVTQQAAFPGTHGVLEAPFGFGAPEFGAYRQSWLDPGRYLGGLNAPSVHDVDTKIGELASHPERDVLVPKKFRKWATFDGSTARLWLEVEYGAPYGHPLEHPVSPYSELCRYVETHYHQIKPANPNSYKFEVWRRNP